MPPSQPEPPVPAASEALREVLADRILTVPNALSFARLLGVPVFLWLLLGPEWDVAAIVVLALAGISDYLDGKLARWLNQASRLGALLDPLADRLYIVSTLVAFVLREVIPLWVAALIIGRDLVLALCLPILRHYSYPPLSVHYLGKAATFNLLYAFPLLLLAEAATGTLGDVARPLAYAFTAWGAALYVWSAVLYLVQVIAAVRTARAGAEHR